MAEHCRRVIVINMHVSMIIAHATEAAAAVSISWLYTAGMQ